MTRLPQRQARVVLHALGRVCLGVGATMLPVAVVAGVHGDLNDATALTVGAAIGIGVGSVSERVLRRRGPLTWNAAFVTIGWAWLVASLLGAVPLYLSGGWRSFVGAWFEAMAGLTTTGLSMADDLDHLGLGINLWRHTLQLIGAGAAVVGVHALLRRGNAEVATLLVPQGRDDRVLPSLRRTGRELGRIALVWATLGAVALLVALLVAGHTFGRAVLHAVTLAGSALATGGFALTSGSVGQHHAVGVELVVALLMLAGAVSLVLHQQLWRPGGARSAWRDLDARTFAASFAVLTVLLLVGLARAGTYTDAGSLLRSGVFTLVSVHTTSGLAVLPERLIVTDWGPIAPIVMLAAMIVGGMAASTAGGAKSLRIGIIAKGIVGEVRRVLSPEAALVVPTYHQRRRRRLTDAHVRQAATVLLLVLTTAMAGAISLQLATGASLPEALLTATAAVTNTGLDPAVLSPDTPPLEQVLVIALMWVGRLEFLAVFALIGSLLARPGRMS